MGVSKMDERKRAIKFVVMLISIAIVLSITVFWYRLHRTVSDIRETVQTMQTDIKQLKQENTQLKTELKRRREQQITSRGTHNTLIMEATAYTHTGNRTATGTWPKVGTVAVDPKVIPLGSKLYVEGYGYAVAEDTGRLIVKNRIDVFFNNRTTCLTWGRKKVLVRLLEEE